LEYIFHSFRRYNFKLTLSQREIFKKILRDFRGIQPRTLLAFGVAKDLAISDVARVFGLHTSAIRYYEQIGILPPPMRKKGQRRYNDSVLFRLAVVHRARETGFTLEEIRELFFGFPPGVGSGITLRIGSYTSLQTRPAWRPMHASRLVH
jgi:hypothetical protein